MEKVEVRSRKAGLPKRLLKRIYSLYCSKQTFFRISKKEARELATRDFFRKRNRRIVVKTGLRVHMVRNTVEQNAVQVDWLNVLDHFGADSAKPATPSNAASTPAAVAVHEVDYLLRDRKPAPAGTQYEDEQRFSNDFTQEEASMLHLILLDESIGLLKTSRSKSTRQEILRWVFRPKLAQHPRNPKQLVDTLRIPFNFRLCCSMAGVGWEQVQDGLLPLLSEAERKQFEHYAEIGDGTLRNSRGGTGHATRRRREPPAHAEKNHELRFS
jgi:hypothetical protein